MKWSELLYFVPQNTRQNQKVFQTLKVGLVNSTQFMLALKPNPKSQLLLKVGHPVDVDNQRTLSNVFIYMETAIENIFLYFSPHPQRVNLKFLSFLYSQTSE